MTTIEGHKLKISLQKYTIWAAPENAQGVRSLHVSVMPLSLACLPGRERVRNDRHLQGRMNLPLVERNQEMNLSLQHLPSLVLSLGKRQCPQEPYVPQTCYRDSYGRVSELADGG